MFTLLTAWISQRIVTVTAVSVLTVAAVPTTLVIVSNDDHKTTVTVIQPADDQSKAILISTVKKAGDDLATKLNAAEANCTTQVSQAIATSKVAPALQNQLKTAKAQIHGSVAPIVAGVKSDEDRFEHLAYITPQDEENELADLHLIEVIALGNGQTSGTITVTCQTVMITIQETIQITVVQQTPAPCPPTKEERDDD
jgi:hypothetical protein